MISLSHSYSPLQNLIAKAPDANAPAMLGSKVLPLCASLLGRKWSDEEIDEDLTAVKEVLAERLKGMRFVCRAVIGPAGHRH